MKPFLEKIAERLLSKFPQNMDEVAVVLPSKRSVVFFKHYLSKKIIKPVFLPKFFSIEEFIEDVSALKVVDNVSLQFHLYKSYLETSIKNKDTFNDFLTWSSILLHDFNDIDTNMVNAKSLYSNLKNVKELENWNLEKWSFSENKLTDIQQNYLEFFESMLSIYESFSNSLIKQNSAYQGLANRKAAEKISSIKMPWKKVWFVGLNALTSSQHIIIDDLKRRDIARVFWDADQYYFKNKDHEAGLFLKQQQSKWAEIDFQGIGDYFSKPKDKFQVIACPQNIAQAHVMSQCLFNLDKDDLKNSSTAVVLADETLLYPVLNNIPKSVQKLNVTMGSPIKNTPFFSFVNSFLLMKKSVDKYKKNKFYYKDLFLFIDDPYFKKIINISSIRKLKEYINKNNIVFVSSNQVYRYLNKNKLDGVFMTANNAEELISQLKFLILQLRSSLVTAKATLDSEILNVFNDCISVLEKLFNDFSYKVDLQTVITIVKQLISQEIIPFKGEPLEGIQLMGILESRTLDFKNIIMLGVNEGLIPKGKSFNSFIPFELKKYFNIPTYSERDAVFSYHFYRLLQRAKNITLVYSTKMDDFGIGEKSRFITQLLSEYKSSEIEELTYQDEGIALPLVVNSTIKNIGLDKELKNWAENGVSPSALNKYRQCSLDFYYHYLAKIREKITVDEFADNSIMGNAIHNAMDKHYPIGILKLEYFDKISSDIINSISEYYKENLSDNNYDEGENYLSLKVAERLTNNFLNFERSILNKGKIQLLFKEQELSHSLKVDGHTFHLKGNVDRVDFYNKQIRIIDYKSGKPIFKKDLTFSSWNQIVDDPKKDKLFQVLMYTYLFLKSYPHFLEEFEVIAGIFSLRNLEDGLLIASQNDKLIFNYGTLDSFELQLIRFLRQVMSNDFSANDDPRMCEFCNHSKIFS